MNKLCEYSILKEDNINKCLECSKLKNPCGYYRWCNTDMCIKMIPSYLDCNIRRHYMGDKTENKSVSNNLLNIETSKSEDIIIQDNKEQDIVVENNKQNKSKNNFSNNKSKKCNVVKMKKGYIINFDGIGLSIEDNKFIDKLKDKNEIIVIYQGEIGKEDFKIVSFE